MDSLILQFGLYLTALAGVIAVGLITLKGFHAWIELERAKLGAATAAGAPAPIGARIEVADLKERVRRLEAIAAGVDI